MDIIGIKNYGDDGRITGQLRVAGLFSASAYNLSTLDIPLVRLKADEILKSSGYPFDSYSGHALLNVLETFPRDELFQISPAQLARIPEEVLKLDLTPRPRVFIRRDEFERFVFAFLYVPRDRFKTPSVRVAIVSMLEEAFGGQLEYHTPFLRRAPLSGSGIVILAARLRVAACPGTGPKRRTSRKLLRLGAMFFAARSWNATARKASSCSKAICMPSRQGIKRRTPPNAPCKTFGACGSFGRVTEQT